jgi:hypothetical protein
MVTKQQLQQIPEFIALPAKLRQYVTFTLIWQKSHGTACRLLKLNKKRTANDPRIQECLEAIGAGAVKPPAPPEPAAPEPTIIRGDRDLPTDAKLEAANRYGVLHYGAPRHPDPAFATTTFELPDGTVLGPEINRHA